MASLNNKNINLNLYQQIFWYNFGQRGEEFPFWRVRPAQTSSTPKEKRTAKSRCKSRAPLRFAPDPSWYESNAPAVENSRYTPSFEFLEVPFSPSSSDLHRGASDLYQQTDEAHWYKSPRGAELWSTLGESVSISGPTWFSSTDAPGAAKYIFYVGIWGFWVTHVQRWNYNLENISYPEILVLF